MLERASDTGNFDEIERRLNDAAALDQFMKPGTGKDEDKYKKAFVQTIHPKILDSIQDAITNGKLPEITITLPETKKVMKDNSLGTFGSPQDFVYGFTSERYDGWGTTLETMGFQSACMSGEGQLTVTMAPRFLDLDEPDLEVDELDGAISKAFLSSLRALFADQTFIEKIIEVISEKEFRTLIPDVETMDKDAVDALDAAIKAKVSGPALAPVKRKRAEIFLSDEEYEKVFSSKQKVVMLKRRIKKFEDPSERLDSKQEQVALKYMDEGKFLQKVLGGETLEDIQSNVKMQKNPWRGNKCEVDKIYRIVGKKQIILVEAKAGTTVSRAQLYQLYETYKLKLPDGWRLKVIAVLMSAPSDQKLIDDGVSHVIDVVDVGYDDGVFGELTESLAATEPRSHTRWHIRSSTAD